MMNAVAIYQLGTSDMTKEAWGPLMSGVGKGLSFLGSKILPKAWKAGRYAARGGLKSSLGWGVGLGGLGAVTAPEGQRIKGFMQGFVPGALSMGAWHGASRLARAGIVKGLGQAGRVGRVSRLAKSPWFSNKRWLMHRFGKSPLKPGTPIVKQLMSNPLEAAKAVGSKALMTAAPFGAAWVASDLTMDAMAPSAPGYMPAATGAAYAASRQLPRYGYGLTAPIPQGYGYNRGYPSQRYSQ